MKKSLFASVTATGVLSVLIFCALIALCVGVMYICDFGVDEYEISNSNVGEGNGDDFIVKYSIKSNFYSTSAELDKRKEWLCMYDEVYLNLTKEEAISFLDSIDMVYVRFYNQFMYMYLLQKEREKIINSIVENKIKPFYPELYDKYKEILRFRAEQNALCYESLFSSVYHCSYIDTFYKLFNDYIEEEKQHGVIEED